MLDLTEVMPGGCPDSDTLRSRDCVTGDSCFQVLFIILMLVMMVERSMMILMKIYHLLFGPTKVYCGMWNKGARSAEWVDRPVQEDGISDNTH